MKSTWGGSSTKMLCKFIISISTAGNLLCTLCWKVYVSLNGSELCHSPFIAPRATIQQLLQKHSVIISTEFCVCVGGYPVSRSEKRSTPFLHFSLIATTVEFFIQKMPRAALLYCRQCKFFCSRGQAFCSFKKVLLSKITILPIDEFVHLLTNLLPQIFISGQ